MKYTPDNLPPGIKVEYDEVTKTVTILATLPTEIAMQMVANFLDGNMDLDPALHSVKENVLDVRIMPETPGDTLPEEII